jgi:hypothetical protein
MIDLPTIWFFYSEDRQLRIVSLLAFNAGGSASMPEQERTIQERPGKIEKLRSHNEREREAHLEANCRISYKPALHFIPVGHPDVGPDGEGQLPWRA